MGKWWVQVSTNLLKYDDYLNGLNIFRFQYEIKHSLLFQPCSFTTNNTLVEYIDTEYRQCIILFKQYTIQTFCVLTPCTSGIVD